MSSGYGGSWSYVEDPAVARARQEEAERQARVSARRLIDERLAALAAWRRRQQDVSEAYGDDRLRFDLAEVPRPAETSGSEELLAYAENLRSTTDAAHRRLDQIVGVLRSELMVAALASGPIAAVRTAAEALDALDRQHMEPRGDEDDAENAGAVVVRVLGRLDGAVPQDRRDALEAFAVDALTAAPVRRDALIVQLRHDVDVANTVALRWVRDAEEAAELRSGLQFLSGGAADRATAALTAVERRGMPLSEDIRQLVAAAHREAAAANALAAAAELVANVVQDFGYEVEKGFSTLAVEDGVAQFRRPSWEGYAVRFRLDGQAASMDFDVVRQAGAGGATPEVRDREVTEEFCSSFPRMLGALGQAGLTLQTTRYVPAGGHVEVVEAVAGLEQPHRRAAREMDR